MCVWSQKQAEDGQSFSFWLEELFARREDQEAGIGRGGGSVLRNNGEVGRCNPPCTLSASPAANATCQDPRSRLSLACSLERWRRMRRKSGEEVDAAVLPALVLTYAELSTPYSAHRRRHRIAGCTPYYGKPHLLICVRSTPYREY